MPRTNTVNFIQIEHGLQSALQTCRDTPEAPYSLHHNAHLFEVANELTDATTRTDRLYLAWRETMKVRLISAKQLAGRFEVIRDELGEYGIEAKPKGRVTYWDPAELIEAAKLLIATVHDTKDVPEADVWGGELKQLTQGLERALREEQQSLVDYQRIAPLRRRAIYRAIHAIDEFEALRRDYGA